MSRYPRYLRRQHEHADEANIRRAIGTETFDHTADPVAAQHFIPTAVDGRRLRGIPAIGRNVRGAIPGTNPEDAIR